MIVKSVSIREAKSAGIECDLIDYFSMIVVGKIEVNRNSSSWVLFKLTVPLNMPKMVKISTVKVYIFCKAAGTALRKIYTLRGYMNFMLHEGYMNRAI